MQEPARTRRSQQERSAAARRRLCEATVEALARHGYRGTTTQRVAELAHLSRGAMQHHYGSKIDLVAEAAEHLLNGALARTIEAARRLQPGAADPFRTLVDELWQRLVSDCSSPCAATPSCARASSP
jgi:AcrR family transcriptional regulator